MTARRQPDQSLGGNTIPTTPFRQPRTRAVNLRAEGVCISCKLEGIVGGFGRGAKTRALPGRARRRSGERRGANGGGERRRPRGVLGARRGSALATDPPPLALRPAWARQGGAPFTNHPRERKCCVVVQGHPPACLNVCDLGTKRARNGRADLREFGAGLFVRAAGTSGVAGVLLRAWASVKRAATKTRDRTGKAHAAAQPPTDRCGRSPCDIAVPPVRLNGSHGCSLVLQGEEKLTLKHKTIRSVGAQPDRQAGACCSTRLPPRCAIAATAAAELTGLSASSRLPQAHMLLRFGGAGSAQGRPSAASCQLPHAASAFSRSISAFFSRALRSSRPRAAASGGGTAGWEGGRRVGGRWVAAAGASGRVPQVGAVSGRAVPCTTACYPQHPPALPTWRCLLCTLPTKRCLSGKPCRAVRVGRAAGQGGTHQGSGSSGRWQLQPFPPQHPQWYVPRMTHSAMHSQQLPHNTQPTAATLQSRSKHAPGRGRTRAPTRCGPAPGGTPGPPAEQNAGVGGSGR